jgi:hypothetical protein
VGEGETVVLTEGVVEFLSEVGETVLAQSFEGNVGKGLMGCDTALEVDCTVSLDGDIVLMVTT